MTEAVYAVVFSGEVLEGFSKTQVQASFARLFGLNAERLEQVFRQPRTVLKKGLSHDEATRYSNALQRFGAAVRVESTALAQPAQLVQAASQPAVSPGRGPSSKTAAAAPLASSAAVNGSEARTQGMAIPSSRIQATEKIASEVPARTGGTPPPATHVHGEPATARRELGFEFHGEGFEFFRIWIVNILLSIVTLGIYSAWAKVRTQRYFYGNTQLDGSSFDYLADPLKILKGRVIAFACLMIYSAAGEISVLLGMLMGLLFLAALPWILVRGLSFRNSNSAWRGVRFGFDASYGEAAMTFLVWPLLGVLTLGILMPLALHKQQRFIAGNSRYGTSRFALDVGARPFYMIFLVILAISVGLGIVGAVLQGLIPSLVPVVAAVGYLLMFAFFNVRFTNLVYGNLVLGDNRLAARYELGSFAVLMLVNMLGLVLTLGLFYPWAKVRTARYAAEHMALLACDDLDGFVAARREEVSSLGGELGDLFDVELAL